MREFRNCRPWKIRGLAGVVSGTEQVIAFWLNVCPFNLVLTWNNMHQWIGAERPDMCVQEVNRVRCGFMTLNNTYFIIYIMYFWGVIFGQKTQEKCWHIKLAVMIYGLTGTRTGIKILWKILK